MELPFYIKIKGDEETGGEINELDDDEEFFVSENDQISFKSKNKKNQIILFYIHSKSKFFVIELGRSGVNGGINLMDDIQPPAKKARTLNNTVYYMPPRQQNGANDHHHHHHHDLNGVETRPIIAKHTAYQINSPEPPISKLIGSISSENLNQYVNNATNQGVVINEITDLPASNMTTTPTPPASISTTAAVATNGSNTNFIDTNLFLNTVTKHEVAEGPIITTPASPIENNNPRIVQQEQPPLQQQKVTMVNIAPSNTNPTVTSLVDNQTLNATTNTLSPTSVSNLNHHHCTTTMNNQQQQQQHQQQQQQALDLLTSNQCDPAVNVNEFKRSYRFVKIFILYYCNYFLLYYR
jgi:hypothetical protein